MQVYSGAALAMSARLKWDPSAYVLLRELLPMEYNAAAMALPTLALLLLLLGHLAHATTPPSRRLLYSVSVGNKPYSVRQTDECDGQNANFSTRR